jgi:hypothetical protein
LSDAVYGYFDHYDSIPCHVQNCDVQQNHFTYFLHGFHSFPQFFPANTGSVPQIKPQLLSLTSFSITLPFNAM